MTLNLAIYCDPYKICIDSNNKINESTRADSLSTMQVNQAWLSHMRAALLLGHFSVPLDDVAKLYNFFLNHGSMSDLIDMKLFLADLFHHWGSYDISYEWLESIEEFEENQLTLEYKTRMHLRKNFFHLQLGQDHIAYRECKISLKKAIESNSPILIALNLYQMANILIAQDAYDLALNYLHLGIELSSHINAPFIQALCLISICEISNDSLFVANSSELINTLMGLGLKLKFPAGYANAVLKKMCIIAESNPDQFSEWIEGIISDISTMENNDIYLHDILHKAFGEYSELLNDSISKKIETFLEKYEMHSKQDCGSLQSQAKELYKLIKTIDQEYLLKKQAEKSARISARSYDYYRMASDTKVDTASHEIKNAASVLKMSVEAIKDGHLEMTHQMLRTMLNKIDTINHIAEALSNSENEELNHSIDTIRPSDLNTSLGQLVEYCETAYPCFSKRIEIVSSIEDKNHVISAPIHPISQILDNLVSNALKYSASDSFVTLNIVSNRNTVKVHVIDRGIGIKKEDFDKLFAPYARLAVHQADGIGIGLHHCKNLAKKLCGRITVTSKPGEGSVFTLALPTKLHT